MRKSILVYLTIVLMVLLCSCSSAKDENIQKVTFCKYFPAIDMIDEVPTENWIVNYSDISNKNRVCAYVVKINTNVESDKLEEAYKKSIEDIKSTGVTIITDYPYCWYNNEETYFDSIPKEGVCAIVGTKKEIDVLFGGTEIIGDYYFYVQPAVRPDYVELARKYHSNYDGELTMDDLLAASKKGYIRMKVKVE